MNALTKRVEALEGAGVGGPTLVLISWMPAGGRETATFEGVTYTQQPSETSEEFRERLGAALGRGRHPFVWVSELDARL